MVLVETYLWVVVEDVDNMWEEVQPDENIDAKLCDNMCGHNHCKCAPHLSKRGMELLAMRKLKEVEELTKETQLLSHEALRRYFVRLTQYGYYDYQSTYRLLALLMINSFRTEFAAFHNKRDEAVIERVLNCLYCSICAIPRPDRIVETEVTTKGSTRRDYINEYEQ